MKVLSIRRLTLEFTDLHSRHPLTIPRTPLPRYPGLHQSDILHWIAINKTGKLKAGERMEDSAEYPLRWALGQMWEEFWFSLLPNASWQPGEVVVDEVAVNPDGITLAGDWLTDPWLRETDLAVLEETKCTECKALNSAEELLEKFSDNWWVYQHQARGYCYVYGTRVVRWAVMHYRGDWRGSGPIAMEYVVRFEDKECEDTWRMEQRWKGKVAEEMGIKLAAAA